MDRLRQISQQLVPVQEWPDFKADHSEGHDEEWEDEGGLNDFQEVMSGFLSDMVEEVVEEIK